MDDDTPETRLDPAKIIRLGTMVDTLLKEVRQMQPDADAPADDRVERPRDAGAGQLIEGGEPCADHAPREHVLREAPTSLPFADREHSLRLFALTTFGPRGEHATRGMVDQRFLTRLPPGSLLVNTARGEVVAPRAVFGRLAAAWEDGDEETLAGLVHGDGLRVTAGPSGGRVNHYSPSQAYYYFRNVFRAHRTLLFEFEMMQDATAGERVHGMATWKRRRPDSEHVEVLKLVCTLVREDDAWKLAEINTIR